MKKQPSSLEALRMSSRPLQAEQQSYQPDGSDQFSGSHAGQFSGLFGSFDAS